VRLRSTCRQVEHLAEQKFEKAATLVSPLFVGGFNILYRIRLEGVSSDVIVRLPAPSLIQFPEENPAQEAAMANSVAKNTQVPVPRQFVYGQDPSLGSFVILQQIEKHRSISARVMTPNNDPSVIPVLNPDILENPFEDL